MDRSIEAPGRVVFYSWWSGPEGISAADRWRLETSVASLRAHNRAISVRLFVFGAALPADLSEWLIARNVLIEEMGDYEAALRRHCSEDAAAVLARMPNFHRWLCLLRLVEGGVERALYLDTDTYLLKDVSRLFEDNRDFEVYAREEPLTGLHHRGGDAAHVDEVALAALARDLGARPVPPINIGVVLMSGAAMSRIAGQLGALCDIAYRFTVGALPYPSKNTWIKDEISVWLLLGRTAGVRVGLLSPRDVLQGGEWRGGGEATVVHYFSRNLELFRAELEARERPAAPAATEKVGAEGPREHFLRLGERVEEAWRARGWDEDAFPEIAEAALIEARTAERVGALDTLAWAVASPSLPPQVNVNHQFGQPPIQVYVTPRFYIEVLHWLDGTTSIHQHGFNGAFAVLAGSSVQALYRLEDARRHGARVRTGRVVLGGVELLGAGDVRRIGAGAATAHSLFHLERPSVTVVVRTRHLPDAGPQLDYLRPSLAYDTLHRAEWVVRKLQALRTLRRLGHPELEALVAAAYREADALGLVQLALDSYPCFARREDFIAALEGTRAQHGGLVDAIAAAVEEERRVRLVRSLRAKLRDPEHRFLLALLLHFDEARPILELVRARRPERAPEDTVVEWLAAMTRVPDPGAPGRRLFGYALDGDAGVVARSMMGTRSVGEVLLRMSEVYEAEDVAAQAAAVGIIDRALRGSRVFGALFR